MHALQLTGSWSSNNVTLNWKKNAGAEVDYYEIEKSTAAGNFQYIGKVQAASAGENISFKDFQPVNGGEYRVKAVTKSGNIYYSPIIKPNSVATANKAYLINNNSSSNLYLVANANEKINGTIALYNLSGRMINKQQVMMSKGINTVRIDPAVTNNKEVMIINVTVGNELVLAQKIIN